MTIKIIGLSGSLRRESYTTKLLKVFQKSAPAGVEFEIIPIGELPFFNEDIEGNPPESVRTFHDRLRGADAFFFATPEYSRSYSGVLKNALEWGSRAWGVNLWNAKPAAVVGSSPYKFGGINAVNHLRQVMMNMNLYTMQQPEFYATFIRDQMDEEGNITNPDTMKFINTFWEAYTAWIANFRK